MKIVFGVIFILMLCSFLVPYSVNLVGANQTKTIAVPTDYPTISQAIASASTGDTINVKNGVYLENIVINKSVWLIGDGAASTVIIGKGGVASGQIPVINITAPNVKIDGFTIQSENYSKANLRAAGISINADNAIITHNQILGTYYGIFCSSQSGTMIAHNNITGAAKDGIRWTGGSKNTFLENNILNSGQSGISIEGFSDVISKNNLISNGRAIGLAASYSLVFGNTIDDDVGTGLYIGGSYNTICANTISNNSYGVWFTFFFANPQYNKLYLNNIVNSDFSNVYFADFTTPQTWDNQLMQGNYFSDYTGADSNNDGVGDTPYFINSLNNDTYPLMKPVNITAQTAPSQVTPITPSAGSTLAWWGFNTINAAGVTPDSTGLNPAIMGTTLTDVSFTPSLVPGKTGNALRFDGVEYAYVSTSPILDVRKEFSFEAVISPQQYKPVDYNIIFMEAARTAGAFPNRVLGFAVNGNPDSTVPLGALRGFMLDENGVFNEIISSTAVVPIDQWTRVTFTRSLSSGLHLYINDKEVSVTVTSGSKNPSGLVGQGGEIYIGHDSISTIDELGVKNYPVYQDLWGQGSFLPVLTGIVAAVIVSLIFLKMFRRKEY
jgi:nitrous oxidase accessory protein